MERERQISDADLMDVAVDPQQARRLRRTLKVLADNPSVDGPVKEMAREVLAGRISMSQALQTGAYTEALGERMSEIRRAAQEQEERQTPEERERAERWLRDQRAEEEREDAEADGPQLPSRPAVRPKHLGGPGGNHV